MLQADARSNRAAFGKNIRVEMQALVLEYREASAEMADLLEREGFGHYLAAYARQGY